MKVITDFKEVPLIAEGILLVDKPAGWTSFDVVNKVRSTIEAGRRRGEIDYPGKRLKVGHTGTLDPLATGLLVLAVGAATKGIQKLTKLDKTYEVTMKLGQTSTTGDEEGDKTMVSARQPSEEEVNQAVEQFIGDIEQTPPAYSAIKVNGQRAYKLARQGKVVKIEPRQIKIYSITEVEYNYPLVSFEVKVSSGTYIRTLAEDIGKVLKAGAYLTNLRRTSVGDYQLGS